ncbi:MAG TPA: hypothetical protein VMS93_14035 [Candidatus Saccharimonadales bacterium]|nr:hypothetical protein [Candidatus Saccharimonadales bacterium]
MTSTTAVSPDRNSTAISVNCLVTLKGVRSLLAVDARISINGFSPSGGSPPDGVPQAWQAQSGGPADQFFWLYAGGSYSSNFIWPNLFHSSPVLPSTITIGSYNYGLSGSAACMTPGGTALIWLMAAGRSGVHRDPAVEYDLMQWRFDLDSSVLQGDAYDPNPSGVCIKPNWLASCGTPGHGNVMAIEDSTGVWDYVPCAGGYQWLSWENTSAYSVSPVASCLGLTPTTPMTWGRIRRLYR